MVSLLMMLLLSVKIIVVIVDDPIYHYSWERRGSLNIQGAPKK